MALSVVETRGEMPLQGIVIMALKAAAQALPDQSPPPILFAADVLSDAVPNATKRDLEQVVFSLKIGCLIVADGIQCEFDAVSHCHQTLPELSGNGRELLAAVIDKMGARLELGGL